LDPRITLIVEQFTVATNTFTKALAGTERSALLRRPSPHSNSMLWVAGHLTQFRCRLARLLGSERAIPWETLFATGSHAAPDDAYPPHEDVVALWYDVSAEVHGRLSAVSSVELDSPPAIRMPSTDGTLAGALVLLAFHEGYHMGQLGYLRKWLGYSPVYDS
jgi:hypothetical protein